MSREISNTDDVLDSRDVIDRIDELEGEFDDWQEEYMEEHSLEVLTEEHYEHYEDYEELEALKRLAEEGAASPDWEHGETLINESYFADYAEELAGDIGAIDPKAGWPLTHIDWDAAADDLKQDYMEVDYDGTTYLLRA